MKRISFFLALTSFINCNLNSQTVFLNEIKWDFGTANSGTFAPSIPISIQSRVSATEITKSTGIIPDLSLTNNGQGNPGRALIVTGFDPNLNSVGDLEVYDQFIGFSITPSANNFMTITGISMDIRHQGNSGQLPNTASARYRIGNGPWNTIDTDRTINNAWNNISFSTSGLIVNVSTTVEFKIGSGFDQSDRQKFWENKSNYIGSFVKYKHFPIGVKDKPRHPIFLGFRDKMDM